MTAKVVKFISEIPDKVPADKTERLTDILSGGSLGAGFIAIMSEVNVLLEAFTLIVGLIAGIFALFFHYRRWINERKKLAEEVKNQVMPEVEKVVNDAVDSKD